MARDGWLQKRPGKRRWLVVGILTVLIVAGLQATSTISALSPWLHGGHTEQEVLRHRDPKHRGVMKMEAAGGASSGWDPSLALSGRPRPNEEPDYQQSEESIRGGVLGENDGVQGHSADGFPEGSGSGSGKVLRGGFDAQGSDSGEKGRDADPSSGDGPPDMGSNSADASHDHPRDSGSEEASKQRDMQGAGNSGPELSLREGHRREGEGGQVMGGESQEHGAGVQEAGVQVNHEAREEGAEGRLREGELESTGIEDGQEGSEEARATEQTEGEEKAAAANGVDQGRVASGTPESSPGGTGKKGNKEGESRGEAAGKEGEEGEAERGEESGEGSQQGEGEGAEETNEEDERAEEEGQSERSAFAPPVDCQGKYIYMYKLPTMFNQRFLDNCHTIHRTVDMCEAFSHDGAGWPAHLHKGNESEPLIPEGAWYETDQFALEIIFHARMKQYPCLTTDPEQATVFYIPFYPGLSIFRSLYEKDLRTRDKHARLISHWLNHLPWWKRHQGQDHLLVVTRVLIDFTREVVRSDWGNTLLKQSYMRNCSILGIESHPTRAKLTNVHSIPYPTSFHPSSDEDIRSWQTFVRSCEKTHLIAFAGVGHGFGAHLRHHLWKECIAAPDVCAFYDCRNRVCIMKPQNVLGFYLTGRFCLQPPGDTPTRKGMFDCMLAGGIPVVFHDETAGLYKWHLPKDVEDVVVYIPKKMSDGDATGIFPVLRSFSREKLDRMREKVIALIPHLVYAMPGNTIRDFKDAFEIAVENVLKKVSNMELPNHPGLPSAAL